MKYPPIDPEPAHKLKHHESRWRKSCYLCRLAAIKFIKAFFGVTSE